MTCETHKDLEDTIAKQNDKIYQLEKDKDLLQEEIQAINLVEQNHKELNGQLRKEIDQLKLDKIKEELGNFAVAKKDGSTTIVIDHTFDVKGVGTVALGKVLSGKITQYDKINHYPSEIEAMVKSIQMHDDDVKQAVCPARVGLSLKGIKPDEVGRGDIITSDESLEVKSEIEIDFEQSPFYKGKVSENQMCLVSVGLQIKAAKFSSISPIKLTLDKPIIYEKNDICLLVKPESTTVRVIGSGKIN